MSEPEDPTTNPEEETAAEPESTPPPADESGDSAPEKEPAEQAKELAGQAVSAFKGFDLASQIYVIGLGVTLICSLFFSVIKIKQAGIISMNITSGSMVDAGFWGGLAVLAAAAGLGIFLWSRISKKKDSWIPLAIAGAAVLCALCFIVVRTRSSGGDVMNVSYTLLGWWLPFAGAVAAAVVSVRTIVKA